MEPVPRSFLKAHSWVSAGRQRWSCDLWADVCEDQGLQDREGFLCGGTSPTSWAGAGSSPASSSEPSVIPTVPGTLG